jgi:hypothetical protein
MNLSELKKLSKMDIALLAVFIIYLVFPVSTPQWLVPLIDSPIGLVAIFAAAVSIFLYMNPILGVIFVLVAYELLRRNHYIPPASPVVDETQYLVNRVPQSLPSQSEKDAKLMEMNPREPKTLEEEMVSLNAPIGKSDVPTFVQTQFQPVADKSALLMTQV